MAAQAPDIRANIERLLKPTLQQELHDTTIEGNKLNLECEDFDDDVSYFPRLTEVETFVFKGAAMERFREALQSWVENMKIIDEREPKMEPNLQNAPTPVAEVAHTISSEDQGVGGVKPAAHRSACVEKQEVSNVQVFTTWIRNMLRPRVKGGFRRNEWTCVSYLSIMTQRVMPQLTAI